MEDIPIQLYDLENIRCYEAMGADLLGKNVVTHTLSKRAVFVSNNTYEIFEIPKKESSKNFPTEGNFLMFAHNKDFGFWIFLDFTYIINKEKTKKINKLVDNVEIIPYGVYDVINGKDGSFIIRKKIEGKNIIFGKKHSSSYFDSIDARKMAYKTSSASILFKIIKQKLDINYIKGKNEIKIFNKKYNKREK